MQKRNLILHLIFLLIVVLQLYGNLSEAGTEYFVKPLILPWIALYFVLNRKRKDLLKPVLVAFFFSWLGDILLMFAWKSDLWFFLGVGGFFLAQITYIVVFMKYSGSRAPGLLQRRPLAALPFVIYVAVMFYLLFPGLDGLMKPIIALYALSLMLMAMSAMNRSGRVAPASCRPVFLGSLLFLASDSMIAINRFHEPIANAGLWIMLTYILAQYLIMRGLAEETAREAA